MRGFTQFISSVRGASPGTQAISTPPSFVAQRDDGRIILEDALVVMAGCCVPGDTEIEETENAADDIPHCLARCVQRQGAGLVVMGTQGRRGIGRWLLGSVAETFLRRADVPVLLVRPPEDPDEASGGP